MTSKDHGEIPTSHATRFDVIGGSSGTVITDARTGTSAEMSSRMRRYAITMGFRTACFLSMIVVQGPFRWVLFGCAVFLPYVAVLLANQANRRTKPGQIPGLEPTMAPQLTVGHGDVISGQLADEEDDEAQDIRDRVA